MTLKGLATGLAALATLTAAGATLAGEAAKPAKAGAKLDALEAEDLRRRLKIAAANTERTMNEIIVEATEAWLSEHSDT